MSTEDYTNVNYNDDRDFPKLRIYLGGPINSCTDAECTDWRQEAKKRLSGKFTLVDPMDRDYRGREMEPNIAKEIVSLDEKDFGSCQIGLFYAPKPSVGTSMEIRDMHKWLDKIVIIVSELDNPSPWLIVNSDHIFKDFESAFEYLMRE